MSEYNFKIPLVPESVNSLYKINYGHRTIYLSDEARAFKFNAKLFIPKIVVKEDSLIGIDVSYHKEWYYKNGKIKRADSPNLDKLIIDTIFESIGIDDSHLWDWHSKKVQEPAESYTIIKLWELPLTNTIPYAIL